MIAVVPVKTLGSAKSRLRPHLGREFLARLTFAMLGDVVDALGRVASLSRVAVVTPDAEVAEAARKAGAEALLRADPGLNPAVDGGAAELAPDAAEGALVVLGDVPGALPEEIEQLVRAVEGRGVALAPSSDGGSSALVRVPRDVIPAGFGPGSAKVHRDLAARAGVAFREIALPSLATDIDEPADLEAFLASPGGGARTRALLREIAPGPGR